jgi:BirA family transcriptional regulator, biotin operon repressor / biotin---[acetyl-CoA-carboxylase] ligase
VYKILANSPFLTNHVHYLPSCHSTNEIAHDLLSSAAAEGTVVICDDQFAGKGQAGNQWRSKKGENLTFSLILRPVFLKPNEQFLITVALSLAIKDMLEEFLPGEVQIKWPNDIFFDNRKIAGLLIENVLRGNYFDSCIAGIGLNVNQLEFPQEIEATSLALISKQQYSLNTILNKLLASIASFYQELQQGRGKWLEQHYYQGLLGMGEERKFIAGGKEFLGVIEGTDKYGRLLVRKGSEVLVFQHKEVQMLF